MKDLQQILEAMEPHEALAILTPQLRKILTALDHDGRVKFVAEVIDQSADDKLSSMVSL